MNERVIPTSSYGILQQTFAETVFDEVAEQVKNMGYATLDAGYSPEQIQRISNDFDRLRDGYIATNGEKNLEVINEYNTIRSLLTLGNHEFLDLAMNANLLAVTRKLIAGKFILNQQNGVINPPQQGYNQGSWHRDLPYQHFVSTKPLAINALFCVDDFTCENGATFVIPASHKAEPFPSKSFIAKNAVQIEAKAGCFILLDCMTFHSGGFNRSKAVRRAVNHVYNIPYFKQQIKIPLNMANANMSPEVKDILGFGNMEHETISDYLKSRANANP